MMRALLVLLVLGCAACADTHGLPKTSDSDPSWQLNVGKWTLGGNDLRVPPDVPVSAASR
jgi:hypothetical protein